MLMSAKGAAKGVLLAFVVFSVGYLVFSEASVRNEADSQKAADKHEAEPVAGADAPTTAPAHHVIAYYFHNTQRCPTCRRIEQLAARTLREQFPTELESGLLEWRVLNMEEPPNEHFVRDFRLVTSSLVLVDLRAGRQRDYVVLEKVWQLVHEDEGEFARYVADAVRKFLDS
ncbi:MAG: hypothetical protein D6744_18525 [Planctomycetota bacterium]|nr:MAG: hypothetical protein D6744_18525 [Planctomycetota bacterium]